MNTSRLIALTCLLTLSLYVYCQKDYSSGNSNNTRQAALAENILMEINYSKDFIDVISNEAQYLKLFSKILFVIVLITFYE